MQDYNVSEDTIEKIMEGYSKFEGLSKENLITISDSLIAYIKDVGPGLILTLDSTRKKIQACPTTAMEGVEQEITKKVMELIIYFKILNDSTGNLPSLKIYLKIVTNLIPFFMEKLGLISQEDVSLTPLIFALSEGKKIGEGDSTGEKEKSPEVDVSDVKTQIDALMRSFRP